MPTPLSKASGSTPARDVSVADAAFSRSQDGLLLIDQFGRVHRHNDAAAAIIGPVLGETAELDEIFDRRVQRYLGHALTRGAGQFEAELPSGVFVDVRVSLVQSSPVLVLFSLRDATALRMVRNERQRLAATLAEKRRLEVLGELIGGIAHDFNNLLSPILTNSELLEESLEDDEEARSLSEDIRLAATHAAGLVDQIRVLNRKKDARAPSADVATCLHETAQLAQERLSESFSLEWKLEVPANYTVGMTASDLNRILLNLISNARDACAGKGSCCIAARLVETDGQAEIVIEVADNGEGIPPEIRERIFDPYFTTKTRDRGTGLGLAMVRALVEDAGGRIHLADVTSGTCFVVSLPLEARPVESAAPKRRGGLLDQRRLLLIDDDLLVLRASTRILQRAGADVVAEASPKIALERLRSGEHFDLVLTDYLMPDMNGLEVAEAIYAHDASLPVALVSGQIWSEEDATRLRERTRKMFAKPVAGRELVAGLSELLADD